MAQQDQPAIISALSPRPKGPPPAVQSPSIAPTIYHSALNPDVVSPPGSSDQCPGGSPAGERSPEPIDSLNLGFAGQPSQCDYHRAPISQRRLLLSSGALEHNSHQHRDEASPFEPFDLNAINAQPDYSYRPYSYLYYYRFRKAIKVLGIESYPEFATAKPHQAKPAARSSRPAPHPKMTSPRTMEP
ncbi:hypothetical protein MPH_01560, partial [Macrophomina phaseolina MS6]